jgi:ubiquinol-cytochrome c reductase subunit 6
MGFFDVIAAALPWSDAEAEAVKGGASTESTPANDSEGGKEDDAKVSSLCLILNVICYV